MCMNNQIWPNRDLDFDENLELIRSYNDLLDWLTEEACIQEDPTLMLGIRKAQFKLPLNV